MKATLIPGIAGRTMLQVDEGRCIAFMGPENAVYATPMDMRVTIEYAVTHVEGRKVRCAFTVRDEVEECGSGVHVRFVVDAEKTRQRLAQKRAAARKP